MTKGPAVKHSLKLFGGDGLSLRKASVEKKNIKAIWISKI